MSGIDVLMGIIGSVINVRSLALHPKMYQQTRRYTAATSAAIRHAAILDALRLGHERIP